MVWYFEVVEGEGRNTALYSWRTVLRVTHGAGHRVGEYCCGGHSSLDYDCSFYI